MSATNTTQIPIKNLTSGDFTKTIEKIGISTHPAYRQEETRGSLFIVGGSFPGNEQKGQPSGEISLFLSSFSPFPLLIRSTIPCVGRLYNFSFRSFLTGSSPSRALNARFLTLLPCPTCTKQQVQEMCAATTALPINHRLLLLPASATTPRDPAIATPA